MYTVLFCLLQKETGREPALDEDFLSNIQVPLPTEKFWEKTFCTTGRDNQAIKINSNSGLTLWIGKLHLEPVELAV